MGILGGTAGIGILGAEIIKGDADFCVGEFVALEESS